ncbi:MAG: hydrogenase maturation protease [Magnetococcales bacterium]|nr:hydrogenase maturation protease [Magnetococcales bacterium]
MTENIDERTPLPLALIGVGSRAGGDDAIGLELVERVAGLHPSPALMPILWEDTDALSLAGELLDIKQAILLVDCADMRLESGSWRLFHPRRPRTYLAWDSVSTHGLGLAEALEIAESLGFDQPIAVFGVQPFDLSPGLKLTPEMRTCLPELVFALQGIVAAMIAGIRPFPSGRAALLK